ncbi:M23 family metallopeptidase [Paenibacillus sp. MMS18-CY102]|uniref:M23 family metallopeptidase n=1 Tax=Paenibacillus sp. MMS18-CY102 TaxID=2682849 RepID=UPI0013661B62|nr:M23 family metallopeptidase [Paenibacillus sp. MMS18-CY102]MWC28757.1 peptidoglycan DD-metalloendopeptidase family protein [Paenibacillus sp. MMS18-CY102]
MNDRIRERQQQRIRRIIEQGRAIPSWEEPYLERPPYPQVEQTSVPPPAVVQPISNPSPASSQPRQAQPSKPSQAWPPAQPSPARRVGIKDPRSMGLYGQDPEKLWKANGAPWLGWEAGPQGPQDPSVRLHTGGSGSRLWRLLGLQFVASAIIFGAVWGMFKLQEGPAVKGQAFVTAALTSEINFKGVSDWYSRTFAGSPVFIPLFGDSDEVQTVGGGAQAEMAVVSPLPESSLVKSFAESLSGIELAGQSAEAVEAAETGQVILIAPDTGKGQTVVIQHAGGRQTHYGLLGDATVNKNDWVEAGDVIGHLRTTDEGEASLLYFAVKQEGRYVDPTDVIPLD